MIEYGITTSKAQYWVHVCPMDASFYIYPRRAMAENIALFAEREITSAKGRLVPIIANKICNGGLIRSFDLEYEWFKRWDWNSAESDRSIGEMAEEAFQAACRDKLLLFPVRASLHEAKEIQFTGRDFRCDLGAPFVDCEIKGDMPGGIWGTGNLFIQTHELHHKYGGRLAHRASVR